MKDFCILAIATLLLVNGVLFGEDKEDKNLFAGTLLALFPENIPPGELLAQANVFASRRYGIYGSHSSITRKLNSHIYTTLLTLETGITEKIDVALVLSGIYARAAERSRLLLGDTFILVGFQILSDKKGTWIPDLRFLVGETFPTGKYQNLDPMLQGADATGRGVYETTLSLIIRKIFYTWPNHPYNVSFNATVGHSSRTKINGLSIFGSNTNSRGTIASSEDFVMNGAIEYKFNKSWGCGIDCNFFYQNQATFYSKTHDFFEGFPSSYLLSLAPMVEYIFNEKCGISGGVWFSVKGRNAFAFWSSAFSAYYLF